MDTDARLCLAKSWEVIARLIMQIGLAVRLLTPLAWAEHNRMLRLTRLAESLTRRWLVLKACELRGANKSPLIPAKAGISCHKTASQRHQIPAFAGMSGGGVTNPRPPLFRLVEPQPRFTHEDTLLEDACAQYGLDLSAIIPAHPERPISAYPGLDPGSQDGLPDSWHEVPDQVRDDGTILPNPTRLWVRSRALIDVMQRRDHHVQRMARWLARAELKRQRGLATRLHPFRVGRPPGARRLPQLRLTRAPFRPPPKDPDKLSELTRQATLRDLAFFAREALNQRAPP